jgi:hypothetical protein
VASGVVTRFLAALGCVGYDLAFHSEPTGAFDRRFDLNAERVVDMVPAILRRNFRGDHIYVRPAGAHAMVLVDDLTLGALSSMERAGVRPAAIVRTSESNHQAWVRLSPEPVSAPIRKAVARGLAVTFGGDRGSADAVHFGRMAGFLNMKPKHIGPDGRHPWAVLWDADGRTAMAGLDLIAKAEAELAEMAMRVGTAFPFGGSIPSADASAAWLEVETDLTERFGPPPDRSARDFGIVMRLFRRGHHPGPVLDALVASRADRGQDALRYAERTIGKALALARPVSLRWAGGIP